MAAKLGLPIKGINKGTAVDDVYEQYSPRMNNVRARDVLAGRIRIGQRPGLSKWGAGTLIGAVEQPVVAMCVVSTMR